MRVGFYLFASRLGGAEAFFRQLIDGIDREHFEPVVFLPPWPGLADFLGVRHDSDLEVHVVETTEPSVVLAPSAVNPDLEPRPTRRRSAGWRRGSTCRQGSARLDSTSSGTGHSGRTGR